MARRNRRNPQWPEPEATLAADEVRCLWSTRRRSVARVYDWVSNLPRPDLQKYLRAGTDLVAGAFEIAANRLACSAEMTREERLGDGDERQPIRRLLEAVAFVGIDDVGDRYAGLPQAHRDPASCRR